MLQLRRITQIEDSVLDRLIELYKLSFPEEERRDIPQLKQMILELPEMYFNAIELDDVLCGLAVYWDFADFYYLEHLAVFPEMRNHKIGKQVLDYWKKNLQKMRILEVEPAEDEMTCRRIAFYERTDLQILTKDYVQPSYRKEEDSCSLWIMGSEENENLDSFIQIIKTRAYREPLKYLKGLTDK